ncbi:CHASE2 domain-containing protein [Alkalinema sp. FACHB-956]|uniref:CHASE2 domain-containing protein n=1 Tax=Alkalinema sp. FACHB-956 TaxID=2692768 RepID=UPI0016849458|nr:CHASE2 domain-containing protein [Alkalinema sp. FACHB-956]MBD2326101.1 CHASE2 domain-containing protein [Alkalinema sp. FACHB-956]
MGLLLVMGALKPLELLSYNTLFWLRGQRSWDDRVVLVAIDDDSIRRLERFPWRRKYYAQVIDVLTKASPSVIAFDLIFSESSADDAQLAEAMLRNGRVVMAQAMDATGLPLQPVPILQESAVATGHLFGQPDLDGITRKIPLQGKDDLALGAVATQVYSLVKQPIALPDLTQPFWINWPGSTRRLQQYSFVDVLEGRVPANAFQDKVVLIGVTGTGFDTMLTPFDQAPATTGVYLHAAVASNLLQGNSLRVYFDPVWTAVLLLLMPGLSVLLSVWRTEIQLAIGATCGAVWIITALILLHSNIWIPVALPVGLLVCTTIAVALCERLRMNWLLQRQVRYLWEAYVPDLMQQRPDWQPDRLLLPSTHPKSIRAVVHLANLAEELGRSQSTQSAISRSLSVALVALDVKGHVWFCNALAGEWLGVEVGQNLEGVLVPHWYPADQWHQDIWLLCRGQEIEVREVEAHDHSYSLTLQLLEYKEAQKVTDFSFMNQQGLLLVIEDISDRKQVERNLEKQVQELERISQLKDDFLSTVSHELRTPITNMRLAIQMLKIAQSDKQRQQYLGILEQECHRERDLINDLLDLQRLELGQNVLELASLNLTIWLPEIVDSFETRARTRQQQLSCYVESNLPEVFTEARSLERILTELINNACKYTPPLGEIRVFARRLTGDRVLISVRNTGVEISPEDQVQIFEKFYRIPKSDRWQQGGTGLGLALVKRLTSHLQGTIQVKSEDLAAEFIIELPISYT